MAPSAFHHFPQLPYELRLQIWESAIRKMRTLNFDSSRWDSATSDMANCYSEIGPKTFKGIHYVTLSPGGGWTPLEFSWEKPHPANRSAYLWHAGLWMACKESREVMQKCWFGHPCGEYDQKEVDEQVNAGLRKLFYGSRKGPRVIWNGRREDEGFFSPWLMAASLDDMFCINPSRWSTLDEFKLACWRNNTDYAVEFDPYWTSELLGLEKYRPTHSSSPTLILAIKIFCGIATMNPRLPPVIHIMDRYSGWKEVSHESPPVFHDCEHEYILIDPSDPLASNRLACQAPVLRFLDQVDRLLKSRLTHERKSSHFAFGASKVLPEGLSVRKLVRVMVRRDKEMVLEAIKGKAMRAKVDRPASVASSNGKAAGQKPAVRWR
ncbi:hypothetical protein Focb16_v004746 [Fusarium oxysporum f. sp. cubense]|uniref:2EXR domain-containing protein n=1 Tax=Fusarium oxysporum f. sp. cubense TaxID=61366 RepID=A0A559LLI7_FUSOC|nr:hypothetical protein Focb16_v004746 [Fusarium oxysporum f. sp. cubense]